MSPAATGTGMCAFECTASLFAWRKSSHAKFRAIVAHAFGASRVHCGKCFSTSARLWLKRACKSSAVIDVPLVDSLLSCVTIAGDAATVAFAAGTTSTPTFSKGTTSPSGRRRVDVPVLASTLSPTCASVASRPRLMRLCDALLSTRTFLSLIVAISPSFVRSGRSTSHLYLGVVVPFAVTMTVVLVRRLPFNASEVSEMQCMPAPVSPCRMAFVPFAAIVGNACMADACATWSLNVASPRVMSAVMTKSRLHIVRPWGRLRRSAAALASPLLNARIRSRMARYAP
eukprot:4991672-Pleurochrysis_carterae.AAC.1